MVRFLTKALSSLGFRARSVHKVQMLTRQAKHSLRTATEAARPQHGSRRMPSRKWGCTSRMELAYEESEKPGRGSWIWQWRTWGGRGQWRIRTPRDRGTVALAVAHLGDWVTRIMNTSLELVCRYYLSGGGRGWDASGGGCRNGAKRVSESTTSLLRLTGLDVWVKGMNWRVKSQGF